MEGSSFADMAAEAGLRPKRMYTIAEVARASGVPRSTLAEAAKDGDLKTFMPPGRLRGRLVRPEWFDEWMARGIEWAAQA